MAKYSLVPETVALVKTRYRRIRTKLPVPQSLPIFEALQESEPQSMMGQPPVVWHRAEGFRVSDRWGNTWIDWSSGVIIANAGYGRKEIKKALRKIIDRNMLVSYCFAHDGRAELTRLLQSLAPNPAEYRVFLLSTGSEAVENAIKLSRTWALEKYGPDRRMIVSFENSFHGRTLGSQLAGGMQKQKRWIVGEGATFAQVPFPDGFYCEDTSFDLFLRTLAEKKIEPHQIAAVITETFQGAGANFLPVEYAQKLQTFCKDNGILTIYDEVQSGFGRTGKMFCYEHYGVIPDLITCGKGITSSLPLSAVIGRREIMDLYPPGSMTSTHSASPLPVAAALASVKLIQEEDLSGHALEMGRILEPALLRIQAKHPGVIGCVHAKGLVGAVMIVKKGGKEPDPETALKLNIACFHRGLLMTAPVGTYGECLKIAPTLVITADALRESLEVFEAACDEVL